jgi:hypothetical protein
MKRTHDMQWALLAIAFVMVWLTAVGGIVYVAVHFVSKFW